MEQCVLLCFHASPPPAPRTGRGRPTPLYRHTSRDPRFVGPFLRLVSSGYRRREGLCNDAHQTYLRLKAVN